MTLTTFRRSQKVLTFFAFFALIATSRSGRVLLLAENQSLEESEESRSESLESRDSVPTGIINFNDGVAVIGEGRTEPGADSPNIAPRFGGAVTSATGFSAEPTTEIPLPTTTDVSQTIVKDRSKSPIFNIWEYARINGPVHVRTGASDFQQTSTSTSGLNRCEWAIISCCQNHERSRRNSCFDALHCGGAWFGNPCSDRLQMAVYGRLLEVGPF